MRCISIVLLVLTSTAHAENWHPIANLDSNGSVLLFDVAGVTEVKGLRRAWFKSVYRSDQLIPNEYLKSVPANMRSYRSERTLRYFNCADRTSAVMRFFWNGADEGPAGYFYNELLSFRPAAPESLDEQMLDAACNFDGKFADADAARLRLPVVEAKMARPANPDDYFPQGSRQRKEQGSPVVQVCVGPSGDLLREPVVTESSGFPELDGAALQVAKATRYAAGKKDGTAVAESCLKFKIKFVLRNP